MIRFNPNTLDAELVQGDTGTFSFYLTNKDNQQSVIKEGDKILFVLKKLVDNSVIIQKEITDFLDNKITIPLLPSETKELEPGNYIYSLTLIRSDGNVDTLNPNRPYSNFAIKKGAKVNE